MYDPDVLKRVYHDDPDNPNLREIAWIVLPFALAAWAIVGLAAWFLWDSAASAFRFWFG